MTALVAHITAFIDSIDWFLAILFYVPSVLSAQHALLSKRDPRAALGWMSMALVFPVAGPLLYYIFGISRVESRAARLLEERARNARGEDERLHGGPARHEPPGSVPDELLPPRYVPFARVGRSIIGRPLSGGNYVKPLYNGEEAYPAMREAIDKAERTVFLSSYIFGGRDEGERFVASLADAAARGVDVRVLVDGVGGLYSWPRAWSRLRKRGVRVERFLPPRLWPLQLSINLRNHRKVLVCDGKVGFTGGMNIADNHLADSECYRRVKDVHFLFSGPIVAQLQEAFLRDWGFVTGEYARVPAREDPCGDTLCRMVLEGPGDREEHLHELLCGVLSSAVRTVRIMTPYFLPSREMMSALRAAALRGVDVRVLLPLHNNLPFVHWASLHLLPGLLQAGVRVRHQQGPFVHTKLLVVDGCYTHVGSANIDARSLRLNFELTVEMFDTSVARQLTRHFDTGWRGAPEMDAGVLQQRSYPVRVRDALCWLFSPYL